MNPYPPPRQNSELSLPAKPKQALPVWKGDKAFVAVEILTGIISFAIARLMVGSFQDAMQYAKSPQSDQDMARNVITVLFAVALMIYIPFMSILLSGTWRGMKVAYVVTTCLLGCSIVFQLFRIISGATSGYPDLQTIIVIALILTISKVSFCGMRLVGNVGPPLV